jgi:deoxyribodipyrimidine photo-lyase
MRTLLWFKQDLRLDDHPAVQYAAGSQCVLPIYILDTRLLRIAPPGSNRLGVHRARFLLEGLAALDGELRYHGSRLLVLPGDPEVLIPGLVEQLGLNEVVTLDEHLPADKARIVRIGAQLRTADLKVLPADGLGLFQERSGRKTPLLSSFSHFTAEVERMMPVFQPRPAPLVFPALPAHTETLFEPLPTLSQLGLGEPLAFTNSAFPYSGGETAAKSHLQDYLWGTGSIRQYASQREQMVGTESSSKLSPWLAQGSLSSRRVAFELRRFQAQTGANESTHALWRSLLWREFFSLTLRRHGNSLFETHGLKATQSTPVGHDQRFLNWCEGQTGVPLVDACMRELAATGFLSNPARRIAASYLVRYLQQDWRLGAAWFEEHLLDYEPASNWGNWAFIAASASDAKRGAAFNVMRQARFYDPEAEYVAHWLPELREIPAALRHVPFMLPGAQREALRYPQLQEIPADWHPFMPSAA